jgi:hypothetical protein
VRQHYRQCDDNTWGYCPWVFNPPPARLYYADRGNVCTLRVYYKNHTLIYAVRYTTYCHFSTCGPRTYPQQWAWPFAIKRLEAHVMVDRFKIWVSFFKKLHNNNNNNNNNNKYVRVALDRHAIRQKAIRVLWVLLKTASFIYTELRTIALIWHISDYYTLQIGDGGKYWISMFFLPRLCSIVW